MVSSTLKVELQKLLATLERIRQECGQDPEYRTLRQALPQEWPM